MSVSESCSCPGCSGNLVFDIASQTLVCAHCGGHYTVPEYDLLKNGDSRNAVPASEPAADAPDAVYSCDSCGGEIMPGILGATETCPFCGNALVFPDKYRKQREPDFIIPFVLDKNALLDRYREILEKTDFVPDSFISGAVPEKIQARYIPFWLYDVTASGTVTFEAEKEEHIRKHGASKTVVHFFAGKSTGRQFFRGIPQDASGEMPDEISQSLEPYDVRNSQAFSCSWLSGLDARIYDMDNRAGFAPVKERAKTTLEHYLLDSGNYTRYRVTESSYEIVPEKISCALFPIWTMDIRWQGANFVFAMNGQSGKCSGNIPVSRVKLWTCTLSSWFFCSAAGIFPVLWVFQTDETWADSDLVLYVAYGIPLLIFWLFQQLVCAGILFRTNVRSAIFGPILVLLGGFLIVKACQNFEVYECILSVVMVFSLYWCFLGYQGMKDMLGFAGKDTALCLKTDADAYADAAGSQADRTVTEIRKS